MHGARGGQRPLSLEREAVCSCVEHKKIKASSQPRQVWCFYSMKATDSSTKPYRAVAFTISDEEDDVDRMDGDNDSDVVWQRREEGRWRWWPSPSSWSLRLVVASTFAIMLLIVFGGREYHNRGHLFTSIDLDGARGSEEDNDGNIMNVEHYDNEVEFNPSELPSSSSNDYFIPLTEDEREEMKEMLRSTLRTTKNALLARSGGGSQNSYPQRTLVLDSDSPKQFMHMHHMKTGKRLLGSACLYWRSTPSVVVTDCR